LEEEKAFALGVQFVMLRLFGKQLSVVFSSSYTLEYGY